MQFVLYLYGRLSVKSIHLYEILEAIEFLDLDYSIVCEQLINCHEYHLSCEDCGKRIVDIFVISG